MVDLVWIFVLKVGLFEHVRVEESQIATVTVFKELHDLLLCLSIAVSWVLALVTLLAHEHGLSDASCVDYLLNLA